jgi:LysM repeat protein
MQSRWLFLPAASLFSFLASCANHGGGSTASSNPQGLGPFDSRGNYVEAWADSPSQWKKGSSSQIADAQPDRSAATDIPVSPEFVKVEEVPGNAVPYQQQSNTTTTVVYKKPTQTPVARVSPERTVAKNTSSTTKSTAKSTTKSKSSSTVAKSTPKPKATVKKELVKSKSKPKSSSHTVKSGDNLYNIAKRYGTSVAALQKANGTKGAMIRPGQSLVIPR